MATDCLSRKSAKRKIQRDTRVCGEHVSSASSCSLSTFRFFTSQFSSETTTDLHLFVVKPRPPFAFKNRWQKSECPPLPAKAPADSQTISLGHGAL